MKRVLLAFALCIGVVVSLVVYDRVGNPFLTPVGASAQASPQMVLPTKTAILKPLSTLSPTATPLLSATPITRQLRATATSIRTISPAVRTATITTTPVRSRSGPSPTRPSAQKQIVVNGHTYDAYIPAATKKKQYYHYTCEFDAAWVVFKTYGIDVTLDDQLAQVGQDNSVEPYYKEGKDLVQIYGGDIGKMYSGDYRQNFLARSSGQAMRKTFEHYGLLASPVHDRAGVEAALRRGELVWVKVTADFKPGRASVWIKPDGTTFKADDGSVYRTVLGNDHAAVVIGYNKDAVVIRDVLGPTSTNGNRKYEYDVPWDKFLTIWGSQSYDGLAVAAPAK